MKSDNQNLQVEITIAPAEGRKGGQRSGASGSKVPDPPRIPRTTRLMALAIKFQDMVDRGTIRDYADLARLGYVSRARLTQIMNLTLLAPDIQERLLGVTDDSFLPQESQIRRICREILWPDQLRLYTKSGRVQTSSRMRHNT